MSNILKYELKKSQWTLQAFAKEANISLSTLKRIAYGHTDPTLSNMVTISRVLNIPAVVLWPELEPTKVVT